MLNIYLKVTNELRCSQNFAFLDLKKFSPGQFWRAPTPADITEFYKFLSQLKNQTSRSKTVCGVSIILNLKGVMAF